MDTYCGRCQRDFPHGQALRQHLVNAQIHNYCSRCQRDFVTPAALAQHEKNSSNHNICYKCGDDFADDDDLEDHYESNHWWCSRCRIILSSDQARKDHWAEDDSHDYCASCDRHFSSTSNLHSHFRSTKHVDQTVKCPGCTRYFPTVSAMTIHLESGTCASGVTRHMINDQIRAHDRNHLITRRLLTYPDQNGQSGQTDTWATEAAWNGNFYACYFCPKQFGSLQGLNQHLKSPAHEQKMYHCPKCATQFRLFSGLVQHVESESCGISRFWEVKTAMDRLTASLPRMLTV